MPLLEGKYDPEKLNAVRLAALLSGVLISQLRSGDTVNLLDACQALLDALAQDGTIR